MSKLLIGIIAHPCWPQFLIGEFLREALSPAITYLKDEFYHEPNHWQDTQADCQERGDTSPTFLIYMSHDDTVVRRQSLAWPWKILDTILGRFPSSKILWVTWDMDFDDLESQYPFMKGHPSCRALGVGGGDWEKLLEFIRRECSVS